jgi:hypothetical protein
VERRESSVDGAAASAHTRSVRLLRPLADDLERWRASRPRAGGVVFPSANGEAWTREAWTAWCESVFAPAVRACGADGATPQSLRRCFASLLLYEGMQLEEVAQVIGGDPWWMYADFAYTAPDALRCERVGAEAQILRARELTARGELGSAL